MTRAFGATTYLALAACILSTQINGKYLVQGNAGSSATTTFTFTFGVTANTYAIGTFFIGNDGTRPNANEFAVSGVAQFQNKATPLTPQTTILNGVTNQPNPLYNATIGLLRLLADSPAVVIKPGGPATPNDTRAYTMFNTKVKDVQNNKDQIILTTVRTSVLNDAVGIPTDHIAAIEGSQNIQPIDADGQKTNFLFAAVPQAGLAFGAAGSSSGISVSSISMPFGTQFTTYNTTSGLPTNVAARLNVSLGYISATIGDPVNPLLPAALATASDSDIAMTTFYLDGSNGNQSGYPAFYVGFPVTANAALDYGARAVTMLAQGSITNSFNFQNIAPYSAFVGSPSKIVATGVPGDSIYVARLSNLVTSTRLTHLLVLGSDDLATYQTTVHCVPLVAGQPTAGGPVTLGVLADVTSDPTVQNYFASAPNRYYSTPATAPAQLYDQGDQPAFVGGMQLPGGANYPTAFYGADDSVFVAYDVAYDAVGATTSPGLFFSRAIFDQLGRIQNWTQWHRVSGAGGKVRGAAYFGGSGLTIYGTTDPADDTAFNTIYSTAWGSLANDGLIGSLVAYISQQFTYPAGLKNEPFRGGVAGIASFFADPGVNTSGIENASSIIVTGNGRLVYAFTAARPQGIPGGWTQPIIGDFTANTMVNNNDTFPTPAVADPFVAGPEIFDITGPVLIGLGPIVTTDVLAATILGVPYRWLAVGGAYGVAILQDPLDGSGWTFGVGSYPYGLQFKSFGDWSLVKRIVSDGTYLYVLTNTTLDKVLINPDDFAANTPQIQRIASVKEMGLLSTAGFMDVIVTGPLVFLATTSGLYRSGNNVDVTIATNTSSMSWTPIALPESVGVMQQLTFASGNNTMADIQNQGQLYVLDSFTGYYQARYHRLYINVVGGVVGDLSVQPLQDYFIFRQGTTQPYLSYFLNFGGFRDNLYTDGNVIADSRPVDKPFVLGHTVSTFNLPNNFVGSLAETPMSLLVQNAYTRFGVRLQGANAISALGGIQKSFISDVIASDGSGCLLIGGDFGLQVNE